MAREALKNASWQCPSQRGDVGPSLARCYAATRSRPADHPHPV